jgi:hypothetical protein
LTTFQDIIRQAVSDPGSITPRGDNFEEPISRWSARAVIELLQVTHGVDPDAVYSGTPATKALMENAELRGKLERAEDARDMAQRDLRNLRQADKALRELLHDAWTVIANAENFKHDLRCEASHCVEGAHVFDMAAPIPVGPEEWRDAATRWRDRWHATLPALPPTPRPATTEEVAEALAGGALKSGVVYPEMREILP